MTGLCEEHKPGEPGLPVIGDMASTILGCVASIEGLKIALGYLRGDGNVAERLGRPMAGKIAQLCGILSSDGPPADE